MKECPGRHTLVSYESGELTDAGARPVESHLQACEACRTTMSEIRVGDPETRRLRSALSGLGTEPAVLPGNEPRGTTADEVRNPAPPAHGLDRPASSQWVIPDYERVQLCGEGSYGSIWVVRDRVGVYRALKLIDLERMRKARIKCRERAALEAYCRKLSRHPYLITIFHVGVAGPYLYYTMELADDQTTRGLVRDSLPPHYRPLTLNTIIRARRLQVDVAIELVRRLLRGLAKLHSLDLVHRDIKPSNIVFVNRNPKLADIGVMTGEPDSGRPIGTPRYMPPDKVMDKTADVFALGRVFHEMIAGTDAALFPALPEESLWGSMRWDLQRISDVIVRACADSATDRYSDASAMLEDLEATARPPYDSLFEELAKPLEKRPRSTAQLAVQLGFALINTIPWILGFVAVMHLISRLVQ